MNARCADERVRRGALRHGGCGEPMTLRGAVFGWLVLSWHPNAAAHAAPPIVRFVSAFMGALTAGARIPRRQSRGNRDIGR